MGRPPCCDKANVKRGLWTAEEDAKILAYVSNHGIGNWTQVPKKAGLNRCGKSCRLRWTNYLRPDLKHEEFTQHEEVLIAQFHAAIGSRWSLIAKQLPGRTDNDVKNYWNTKLKKKLAKMGIDPITHKPILKILSDYETITSLTTNHQMKEKNESLANSCTTQPKINRLLVQDQFQNTSSSSNNRLLFHLSQFELVNHGSFNHCNLQEISPSSSSSSSSSISNGKSSSHLIISEPSSPTVVNTTASCNWGEASFNEHLLTIDNMEVECNYQKLAPTLDMSMQCKLTSANYMNNYVVDMSKCEDVTKSIEVINNYEPLSSVNSFVKTLLERDCQMQQDFPIFEDILDY